MSSTQNGWPIDGPLRSWTIPYTGHSVQLTADADGATCLLYFLGRWQTEIENIGTSDTGGYDKREIGGLSGGTTSNHRSGTAVDMCYSTKHPAWTNTTSPAHQAIARDILSQLGGTVRWGFDWGDDQHVELAPGSPQSVHTMAPRIRAGQLKNTPPSLRTVNSPVQQAPAGAVPSQAAVAAAPEKPLPVLKALTPLPQTKITGKQVQVNNRLAGVRVSGKRLPMYVTGDVVSASMSYSTTDVSQFSLTVLDDLAGTLWFSQVFGKGGVVDVADQHLSIQSLTLSAAAGGPQIQVKARSKVITALRDKRTRGTAATWPKSDVSRWFEARIREAGGRFLVQPNLGVRTVTRNADETYMDTMARTAGELGCWLFEYEQLIVVGKPTWLVALKQLRRWEIHWNGWSNYTAGLDGQPKYSWSGDSDAGEQLTFGLISADAEVIRPGELVRVTGRMGYAFGNWIVTSVEIPYARTAATAVTCGRVVNPTVSATQ